MSEARLHVLSVRERIGVAWTGLLAPRRCLPVATLVLALLVAQFHFTPNGRPATFVALVLAFTAWLGAPALWYALFAERRTRRERLFRSGVYLVGVTALISMAGPGLARLLGQPVTFLTALPNFVVCWTLALVGGWGLGRDIAFERDLLTQRARVAELSREAERSQLLALRSNLDPHFLFNTLNAIAEWCREDGKVAEQALVQLAGMLRTMLTGVRRPSWPLAQELELVQTFFHLHRLRDAERFRFTVDTGSGGAELETAEVPPFLFLPLAENAVKHGPAAGHPGDIVLELRRTGDRLRFVLSNPGPYKGPRPGSDGLPTLERRLALAYGTEATLDIHSQEERTTVRLELPLQLREARGV